MFLYEVPQPQKNQEGLLTPQAQNPSTENPNPKNPVQDPDPNPNSSIPKPP